jgi:hypothetical protein
MRWWLLLCVLVGCVDSQASTRSRMCEANPNVRFIHQNQPVVALTVATGGTATLSLECTLEDLPGQAPFDLPSTAMAGADDAATAELRAATLTVHGTHAGTTTVAITSSDGATHYGSLAVTVADVDHLTFRSTYDTIPPNVDLAFAKEFGTLAEVELASTTNAVLADDDMIVTPPAGATRTGIRPGVFDIAGTPLGDQTIAVATGGAIHSAPFIVVDHADAVALVDAHATVPASGTTSDLCFAATANGRFVAGLRWAFEIEGAMQGGANCQPVAKAEDANRDGMIAITATAGGASAQVSVAIE